MERMRVEGEKTDDIDDSQKSRHRAFANFHSRMFMKGKGDYDVIKQRDG